MDSKVDPGGTTDNDIELGCIATTQNVKHHITPHR